MTEAKKVKEVPGVKEIKEKNCGVAAFFDLDGTLVALPSLERRFFWTLRYHRAVPARNYWLWLREAVRLAPRGMGAALQANKMYLRGVRVFAGSSGTDTPVCPVYGAHKGGQARMPVVPLLPKGIERMVWHAKQGHAIVLVSGTLEPLAHGAAQGIEEKLAAQGIFVAIRVCATPLEEAGGRWTGQVVGEAMFGEAKARAVKKLAEEMRLDLAHCWAYGNSENDQWMLASVGRPAAVNPSKKLAVVARKQDWPTLRWNEAKRINAENAPTFSGRRADEEGKQAG